MYYYKKKQCQTIEDIINQFPKELHTQSDKPKSKGEFSSPFRSTIPLLILVKDFPALLKPFGVDGDLIFEYETKPKYGIGKPSCSDLICVNENACLVIEAKRTEPKYTLVKKWLDGSENKKAVLTGWLDFINAYAKKTIVITDVLDIPYQAIHRVASACAMKKNVTKIAYFIFDPTADMEHYYKSILISLKRLIGNSIEYYYCFYNLDKSSTQTDLERRWTGGERNLGKEVIDGILQSKLMKIAEKATAND